MTPNYPPPPPPSHMRPPPPKLPSLWDRIALPWKIGAGAFLFVVAVGTLAGAQDAGPENVTPAGSNSSGPVVDQTETTERRTTTTAPPRTTTTVPPTTSTAPPAPVYVPQVARTGAVSDDLFYGFMLSEQAALGGMSRGDMLGFVNGVCDQMDAGVPVMNIASQVIGDYPVTYGAMGFLMGAGVENYCPEHSSAIAAFNEQWS